MSDTFRNLKGELCIRFGHYTVIQRRKNFNEIQFEGGFLCHSTNWKKATKIAKMLNEAFEKGRKYNDGWW